MIRIKDISLLILLLAVLPKSVSAQAKPFVDSVCLANIKSVLLVREGMDLSYPAISINSDDRLLVSFDDLQTVQQRYTYKVIYCNADWTPSTLMQIDYLEGVQPVVIDSIVSSVSTYTPYIHYQFRLPNDNIHFKLSGNYVLQVYIDYDEQHPILTKRFVVVDRRVTIKAEARPATSVEVRDEEQEVMFSVNLNRYQVVDPYTDLDVVVQQNGNWKNRIDSIRPVFVNNDDLDYNHTFGNTFMAGSEFRQFSTKSFRYRDEHVDDIRSVNRVYHVGLQIDESRSYKTHLNFLDLNGRFVVQCTSCEDARWWSDYSWVHFSLKTDAILLGGRVYVVGGFNNWSISSEYELEYSEARQVFEASTFLKQGTYNYQYVFVPDGTNMVDYKYFEGSHSETENDYQIFIYHHDRKAHCDRLIGYQIVNTLNK